MHSRYLIQRLTDKSGRTYYDSAEQSGIASSNEKAVVYSAVVSLATDLILLKKQIVKPSSKNGADKLFPGLDDKIFVD